MVKVDRVISLSDLRRVLPKAIFQTCFTSEGVLFNAVEKLGTLHFQELFKYNGWMDIICFCLQSFWMACTTVCVSWYLLRWNKPTH